MTEDNTGSGSVMRSVAMMFIASMGNSNNTRPIHEALNDLLDRIDREAFERGKQAAELQPVPPPQPAGKAELTRYERDQLAHAAQPWAFTFDPDCVCSGPETLKRFDGLASFVAQLRVEAVAKVERERDEARAELERVRKTLFEQQTREGEWHDWARRASGTDLVSADRLQRTIEEKLDELRLLKNVKETTWPGYVAVYGLLCELGEAEAVSDGNLTRAIAVLRGYCARCLNGQAVAESELKMLKSRHASELERIKKELAEQQTREGEWQCAVSNKIDALEKQLRQALESHADELAVSNSQWNSDQAAGERSLRTLQRQGELDSQLGNTLRATGIKTTDLLAAVQVLYAQPGSRCVVSVLRAIETWLDAGGADV